MKGHDAANGAVARCPHPGLAPMLVSTHPIGGWDLEEKDTTMNSLHFETMARDRMAERDRTIASWAVARSIRRSSPPSPAPLPPLPPSPRLRAPRRSAGPLSAWLHRMQVRLAGAIG
jgi:hypothetical protein